MRTHCLQGVNLPVSALRASWATVPPKKAERGAKQPPEVALKHRNKDSSTFGISTDICALASFAKETMTSASRMQLVVEINCMIWCDIIFSRGQRTETCNILNVRQTIKLFTKPIQSQHRKVNVVRCIELAKVGRLQTWLMKLLL